jgi:hypothetical protein
MARQKLNPFFKLSIVYGSVLSFCGLFFLFAEPARWDHSIATDQSQNATLDSNGSIFESEIECNCPATLVEGHPASLTFNLTLNRKASSKQVESIEYGSARIEFDAPGATTKSSGIEVSDPLSLRDGEHVIAPIRVDLTDIGPDFAGINIKLIDLALRTRIP